MDPTDPAFKAWAIRYGYNNPNPLASGAAWERLKFYRYYLAYQARIPPDSGRAFRLLKATGLS